MIGDVYSIILNAIARYNLDTEELESHIISQMVTSGMQGRELSSAKLVLNQLIIRAVMELATHETKH